MFDSDRQHIAIQRSGKEPVYIISARDYELFQKLLQKAEDILDLEIAEARMNEPQERIGFEEFFQDLED